MDCDLLYSCLVKNLMEVEMGYSSDGKEGGSDGKECAKDGGTDTGFHLELDHNFEERCDEADVFIL